MKPKILFMGVQFDRYTPAVEGQITRDCILLLSNARHKYQDMVVVCLTEEPKRAVEALGLTLDTDVSMAKNWIVYKTGEGWPDVPDGTRTVVQRDLYAPTKRPDMQVLEPGQDTGYYLPPKRLRAA